MCIRDRVTSSSTLAAFGAVGAGIPPYEIKDVVTVVKAYSSAVGAGAFVSELFGEEAEELRRRGGDGGEYGATTGRPRRVGWFDAVATRYGCRMQGTTEVALTVIDPLGYLDEIPICVGYDVNGEEHQDFPNTTYLYQAKPILKTLPGWKCDVTGIRKWEGSEMYPPANTPKSEDKAIEMADIGFFGLYCTYDKLLSEYVRSNSFSAMQKLTIDRKSTRLNSSHSAKSRMPSSA